MSWAGRCGTVADMAKSYRLSSVSPRAVAIQQPDIGVRCRLSEPGNTSGPWDGQLSRFDRHAQQRDSHSHSSGRKTNRLAAALSYYGRADRDGAGRSRATPLAHRPLTFRFTGFGFFLVGCSIVTTKFRLSFLRSAPVVLGSLFVGRLGLVRAGDDLAG